MSALALVAGCSTEPRTTHPELPPLGTTWYDPGANEIAGTIEVDSKGFTSHFKKEVPGSYRKAIEASLEDPLVQYGLKSVPVDTITIRKTEYDEGEADGEHDTITLGLSNGLAATRVYRHSEIFTQVLVHEVTHLKSKPWYRFIHDDRKGPASQRAARQNVVASCKPFRDAAYRSFISSNRSEIADTFSDLASQASIASQKRQYKDMATLVTEDNPNLYNELRKQNSCQLPFVSKMNRAIGMIETGITPKPLQELNYKLFAYANKDFTCITDGDVAADTFNEPPGTYSHGHPWENPNEFTSSLVTALYSNPRYLEKCLRNTPHSKQIRLKQYARAVLVLTDPKLIKILERKPVAERLIKDFQTTR